MKESMAATKIQVVTVHPFSNLFSNSFFVFDVLQDYHPEMEGS
jgi:hypothetical protein